MTGVFRADAPAFLLHFFQHVTVTYFRPGKWNTQLFKRHFQAHITHQRADSTAAQLPLTQRFASNNVHDLVAVDLITLMVNHDDAVTVAVQRDAHVGFLGQHARLQSAHIGRAHFFVNVHTVRLAADSNHGRTQLTQHVRGDVVGGAVGAVDHHFQAIQAQFVREGAFAELNVATRSVDDAAGFTQLSGVHAGDLFFHFGFNGLFYVIRQLGAVDREELDAVIIKRVVRGGDNDTGFGTEGTGQIGYRRSRHRAGERGRQTRCRQTGFQRRLQHIARDTGIFTNDDFARTVACQHLACRPSQLQDEIRGDRRIAHATTNPIGTKIFAITHNVYFPSQTGWPQPHASLQQFLWRRGREQYARPAWQQLPRTPGCR